MGHAVLEGSKNNPKYCLFWWFDAYSFEVQNAWTFFLLKATKKSSFLLVLLLEILYFPKTHILLEETENERHFLVISQARRKCPIFNVASFLSHIKTLTMHTICLRGTTHSVALCSLHLIIGWQLAACEYIIHVCLWLYNNPKKDERQQETGREAKNFWWSTEYHLSKSIIFPFIFSKIVQPVPSKSMHMLYRQCHQIVNNFHSLKGHCQLDEISKLLLLKSGIRSSLNLCTFFQKPLLLS